MTTTLAREELLAQAGGHVEPAAMWLELPGENSLECGDNGEGSRSAPVQIIARTAGVLDHWYWGPMVHDLDGMQMRRNRVVIDWRHDRDQQLGYLNRFEVTENGLECSGALVPYCQDDRAAEIAHKSREGVPYQASIEFGGALLIEEVAPGAPVEVNGQTLTGPLTVFREWTLEAVAICPQGYDRNTETVALDDSQSHRTITIRKAEEMPSENTQLESTNQPAEAAPAVDAVPDSPAAEGGQVARLESEPVEPASAPAAQLSEPEQRRALAQQFTERFGDEHGRRYFFEGLTLDQAASRYAQDLQVENSELRQRLESITDAEEKPLETAPKELEQPAKRGFAGKIRIAGKQYD